MVTRMAKELGLIVLSEMRIHGGTATVKVAKGSVVTFEGDCIVNAANSRGIGGGNVDGAISAVGGKKLLQARLSLPVLNKARGTRIPPGESRTTPAFGSLRCKFVIHTVSGMFHGARSDAEVGRLNKVVENAYHSALVESRKYGCSTVAFSLLSAGSFRGEMTLSHVLNLGVRSVLTHIGPAQTVYMVGYTDEEVETLLQLIEEARRTTEGES